MDFLNRAWSLNYIFYFSALPPRAEVLLISDHLSRTEIDFSIFDIQVTFAVPSSFKEKYGLIERTDVLYFDEKDFFQGNKEFSMIIFDLGKQPYQPVLNKTITNLSEDGYVVLLDWSFSRFRPLQSIVRTSGLFGKQIANFPQKRNYDIAGKLFLLEWYFFVEPGLAKPQYLVREAFKTAIPQDSLSALKNFFNRIGAFYLLPHNKALLLRKSGANSKASPVVETVTALARQSGAENLIDDTILQRILLSRTKVLILDVALGNKSFIIRFPLDQSALERLQKQQKILSLLQTKGFAFIPYQWQLKEKLSFPYFIEEKVQGAEKRQKRIEKDKQGVSVLYEQIFQNIKEIHLTFGRPFVMTEQEFSKYVSPKIEIIKTLLDQNEEINGYLAKLHKYFYDEFYGKKFLAGVCHGDLKIQNCIYNSKGQLTGLIDWDMSARDEITLVDVTSLLANAIRTRYYPDASLRWFSLDISKIPLEFLSEYEKYFRRTKTSYLAPFPALMFYWIDRTYKMIKYNSSANENWARKEIYPVLKRVDYFFSH